MTVSNYEQIIAAIARHGLRITEQRKLIANAFATSEGYISAKEIYRTVIDTHPDLSYDTVYRNLRLLLELGVLEQIHLQDGARFRPWLAKSDGVERQTICLHCAQVAVCIEEWSIPFDSMLSGFEAISLRLYGYCSSCCAENKKKE